MESNNFNTLFHAPNPQSDYHQMNNNSPNYTLPDTLLDDFNRLDLGNHRSRDVYTPRAGGSFLGINNSYNHLLDSPAVFDSPVVVDSPQYYLQRMRVESAIRGHTQIPRQPQPPLDCFGNSNHVYNHVTSHVTNGFQVPMNGNGFQVPSNGDGFQVPSNGNGFRFAARNSVANNYVYKRDNVFSNYLRNNSNNVVSTNNNLNNVVSANNNNNNQRNRLSLGRQEEVLRYSTLEEVRGSIYRLAKEQPGCRFLVEKIERREAEEIDKIFVEIKHHVCDMMVDQAGNFLIQKLFEVCNEEQMNTMLVSVISDSRTLLAICLDVHGTRAVQKMVENLKTSNQKSSFASVLKHITLTLIKSAHGHHVIQNCLKFFSDGDHIKPILDVVVDNCIEIAMDKSGCCTLQHCVGYAEGIYKKCIIDQIISNALLLAEHAYGNYVLQFIVGLGLPQYTDDILRQLEGSCVYLSMNKYGSNVVEKCLKESNEDISSRIISELVYSKDFLMVLQDQYGNYVAQSALTVAKDKQRVLLVHAVQEHYPFIHSHPHGKRVLSRIKALAKNHA